MNPPAGATAPDLAALLPSEPLIAACRNDRPADAIACASGLRSAAAEIVREGYLLHYAEPRFYAFDDPDLALLAGDRMFAAGLDALSAAGDTVAVALLAALIADCAEAHAVVPPEAAVAQADALWASALAMLARDSAADDPR